MATSPQNIQSGENSAARVAKSAAMEFSPVLMLPAYGALFAATGMGAYVLAYHLDVTAFSIAYSMALILAIGATFIANHGDAGLRFGAQMVRFITVPVLLVIAMLGNSELFFTRTWLTDANSVVAGYIGLIMVGCIVMIGLRVEGKAVPVSMPLVATLSLFGLLNLVLVDTIVQIGFLVFAATGMFLIGYERVLTNWQRRRTNGMINGAHNNALSDESCSEAHMRRTARQFVGASAVWFAIFVVGALLAYTPLYAVLPGIMPTNALSRLSQATQKPFDWSSSPEQLEVRGGNHTLTERPILKVRILEGNSPGLWRGRVYRNYIASSWKDDEIRNATAQENFEQASIHGARLAALPQIPTLTSAPPALNSNLPTQSDLTEVLNGLNKTLNPRFGTARLLTSEVEPVDLSRRLIYSSGLPVALRASWTSVRLNRSTGAVDANAPLGTYTDATYVITGRSVELSNAAPQARGLTDAELQQWRRDPRLASYVTVTDDEATNRELRSIAQQILDTAQSEGKNVDTPVSRAMAISAYLHGTCLYTLNSPLTPPDEDGVLYFLNTTKAGACDMFASSMTLLLRSLNVPARLVTGYLEPDTSEQPEGDGMIIRERDAHAWVEYYSPELGWVTHDPSAGTRLADDSWFNRFKKTMGDVFSQKSGMILLFPVIGLLLLGAGLFWPQIEKRMGRTALSGNLEEQQRERIESVYAEANRAVQRYAKTRAKTTVPRRALTAQELDDWLSRSQLPAAARQEFAALTYLRNAARYGMLPPEVNAADLKASLERLKMSLRQKVR